MSCLIIFSLPYITFNSRFEFVRLLRQMSALAQSLDSLQVSSQEVVQLLIAVIAVCKTSVTYFIQLRLQKQNFSDFSLQKSDVFCVCDCLRLTEVVMEVVL